MGKNIYKEH